MFSIDKYKCFGVFVCQNVYNYHDLVVVAVCLLVFIVAAAVDFNYCLEFIEELCQ